MILGPHREPQPHMQHPLERPQRLLTLLELEQCPVLRTITEDRKEGADGQI